METETKYYANYEVSTGAVFVAKSKVMKDTCVVTHVLQAKPSRKKITQGLYVGAVGEDWKGNRIQITSIKMV